MTNKLVRFKKRTPARTTRKKKGRRGKSSLMLTARNPSNRLTRRIGPPSQEYVRLDYQVRLTYDLSANQIVAKSLAINGLWAPEATGGHQPRYFDQFQQVYGAYQVHGMSCKIQANSTATARDNYRLGMIALAQSVAAPADYNNIVERGKGFRETHFSTQFPISKKIKMFVRPNLVQGVSKLEYTTQERFEASVNANPGVTPKIWVFVGTMDNTFGASTIFVDVELVYYCRFFDRLLPTQS